MTLQYIVQITSLEVINTPCFSVVGRRHRASREAYISVAKHADPIPVSVFIANKTATNWEEL